MKTLKFKTNINCGGCVKAVTTALDELAGSGNWHVDTEHPDKILSVDTEHLDTATIMAVIKKTGFRSLAVQ